MKTVHHPSLCGDGSRCRSSWRWLCRTRAPLVKDFEGLSYLDWAALQLVHGENDTKSFLEWLQKPGADLPPVSGMAW